MATKNYTITLTDQAKRRYPDLEQDLLTQMYDQYGLDITYITVQIETGTDIDYIFNEIQEKRYTNTYDFRMYVDDMTLLGGQGDVFAKFGLQIQDEITLFVTPLEFKRALGDDDIIPSISDLIYVEMWNSIFEITFVEDQENKVLGRQISYKLICKKHSPSVHETIDTDVDVIDDIANDSTDTQEFPPDREEININDTFEDEASEITSDDGDDPFDDF